MGVVESMGGEAGAWTVGVRGVLGMAKIRGILPTTDLDLAAGVSGSAQVDVRDHALSAGALLLNTTSGNLMQVTSDVDAATTLGVKVTVAAVGLGFTPWDGSPGTHRSNLTSVTFASDMAAYSALRLDYLLYSCTAVTSVAGLGNLSGVTSMRFTFSSIGATSLDFRGFDPSALTDLYYCFGGASTLATIYADSTWALPSSGISGSQCFYNCRNLIGGNGTTWSSSNVSYTYFRIDTASTPGYLTAAT